jgi:hypothetical protein
MQALQNLAGNGDDVTPSDDDDDFDASQAQEQQQENSSSRISLTKSRTS